MISNVNRLKKLLKYKKRLPYACHATIRIALCQRPCSVSTFPSKTAYHYIKAEICRIPVSFHLQQKTPLKFVGVPYKKKPCRFLKQTGLFLDSSCNFCGSLLLHKKLMHSKWRKGWDSNPRTGSSPITRFRVERVTASSLPFHNGVLYTKSGLRASLFSLRQQERNVVNPLCRRTLLFQVKVRSKCPPYVPKT